MSAASSSHTPEHRPQIFGAGDLAVANVQIGLSRLLSSSIVDAGSVDSEKTPILLIDAFRSLQHFQATTATTLGSSSVQSAMSLSVANTAWSYPYLMHMLLAVSYAHQRRCYADKSGTQHLAFLEAVHWQSGLQAYRQYISTTNRRMDGQDFEAVVGTTFLAIIYTFALEDEISLATFFGDDDQPLRRVLDPLAATGGFRAVQSILGSVNVDSQWNPILSSTDDSFETFTKDRPGVDGVPDKISRICEMGGDSCPQNNRYHRIARLLTPVMRLKPSSENFPTLLAFSGRTWQDFRPLLLQKDPRALLLLSYWLALLHQVDEWWILRRVRTATAAITEYLSSLQDPSIEPLLAVPAAFAAGNNDAAWRYLQEILE